MFKETNFFATCVGLLALALAVNLALADDSSPVEIIAKDKLGLTIPNPLGSKPFFETNNQNGRVVAFHIPFIYDFFLHCHGPVFSMDKTLTIQILSGLVDYRYDKYKQTPDSDARGPVTFSLFGITLYDNDESK